MKTFDFKEMLIFWVRFSGRNEEDFWKLSLPEYQRWVAAIMPRRTRMDREDLISLMELFPDG